MEVTNTRDVPHRAGHHGPACREMGGLWGGVWPDIEAPRCTRGAVTSPQGWPAPRVGEEDTRPVLPRELEEAARPEPQFPHL